MPTPEEIEIDLLASEDETALEKIDLISSKLEEKSKTTKPKQTSTKPGKTTKQRTTSSGQRSSEQHLELVTILQQIQKQGDDTKTELKAVTGKISKIDGKVGENSGKIAAVEKSLAKMKKELDSTRFNHEITKQSALRENVVIFGVPNTQGEDVNKTAILVFKAFGCSFDVSSFRAVYRTRAANTIIVKFADFQLKLKALEAKKRVALGDVANCAEELRNRPIFINNHVTPYFAKILSLGRDAVRKDTIHSCWMGTAGCLAKEKEDSEPVVIRSLDEMKAFTGMDTVTKSAKRGRRTQSNESTPNAACKRQKGRKIG